MNPIDNIPIFLVLVFATLAQVLFIELGFRYGKTKQSAPHKPQMAQVRAIMGASLGLLAFMLAFSFNTAQQHFEERSRAYMMEISAIDSAFRGADLIQKDNRAEAKEVLRKFAKLRVELSSAAEEADMERMVELVRESERMHDHLWSIAESSMEGAGDGEDTGIFAQSVLAMINAHDARLQAALFNRISPVIWLTLFMMSLLSMVVMGYQAGLTGTRSSLATWTLAITFSAVMTLTTDLDRPNMSLFQMNQDLMIELENRMQGGTAWDSAARKP
jgi:ABC-type multidrug transport system fused ATPase/permease subunit